MALQPTSFPYGGESACDGTCSSAVCKPRVAYRSNFLTASDVLTAKKRQLVAKSYFAELQSSRNLTQKQGQLVVAADASNSTRYEDQFYKNKNTTTQSVWYPLLGCCPTNLIAVSSPPTYHRPAKIEKKPIQT